MAPAIVAVMVLGVVVRLRQFMSGRSLWVDEANVALDLADFGVVEALTSKSPRHQMAPTGFLIVSNLADAVSSEEWVLRLFPLVAGLALVLLAGWYASRRLVHPVARVGLVGILSLSPSLIHYSAELKQYEGEALLAFIAVIAAVERESLGRARLAVLAIVMLVFSITALLIVPVLGLGLFAVEARGRGFSQAVRHLLVPGVAVLGCWAVLVTWTLLIEPGYMQEFWGEVFAPAPTDVAGLEWWAEAAVGLSHLTLSNVGIATSQIDPAWATTPARLLAVVLWSVAAIGAVVAVMRTVRARRDGCTVGTATAAWWGAVVPSSAITAAFAIAAIVDQYPFRGRLVLFLVPLVAVVVAHGLDVLFDSDGSGDGSAARSVRVRSVLVMAAAGVIGVAVAVPALGVLVDPFDRWDIEPAIEWIAEGAEPDDPVIVYGYSASQSQYYGDHFTDAGVVRVTGCCDLRMDTLEAAAGGPRFWLLHGHIRTDAEQAAALAERPEVMAAYRGEGVMALLIDLTPLP